MASDQVGKGNSGAGKGPTARIWAPLLAADRDVLEVQITPTHLLQRTRGSLAGMGLGLLWVSAVP